VNSLKYRRRGGGDTRARYLLRIYWFENAPACKSIRCGMIPLIFNTRHPQKTTLINVIFVSVEEIMEEFRHNGRDFEYCPDLDTDATRQIIPRRKKNKKPLPTECVFCRNNGEEETYYREHLLKDVDGRVQCPVLRWGTFNTSIYCSY